MSAIPAWLSGARIAPSAHNTQPWRFRPLADGCIAVRWDPDRTLPAGDPTDRDLFLALGAAVESARLRAAATGTPLRFTPGTPDEPLTVGTLEPAEAAPDAEDRRLAALLDERRSGRAAHLRRRVPGEAVAALRQEAARGGGRLYVMQERETLRRLGKLATQATAALFADRAVHAELWRWLRLDPHDPAYQRDGLTAACMELRGPTLLAARLLLPPSRMRVLTRLGAHRLLAADTGRMVAGSASMCLLTVPSRDRAALVHAGGVLLRLWLLATSYGLRTHPISALLDCTATAQPTQRLFRAEGMPAAVFRLGFTPDPPRAPRLPAEELMEGA